MYHLKNLQSQYIAEHKFSYDLSDSNYNFVRLECISSFPRLNFVLKFLPILGGVGFIEVFSQNKLSRNTEVDKIYREINVCYGSDIKIDSNVDFIYQEPKKLKEIEKFFLEFFVLTNPNKELFFFEYFEIKYFDLMLIACMSEILKTDITTIDREMNGNNNLIVETLLYKINNLYCDLSLNNNNNDEGRLKIMDDQSNDINSNMKLSNMNDTINVHRNNLLTNKNFNNNLSDSVTLQNIDSTFLTINKDLILKQIYIITNKFQYISISGNKNNSNNITLNLTKNEGILNTSNNNGYFENNNSLDLSNKFSDISALENERIYDYKPFTISSKIGNIQMQNILNNISPSYDYILNKFQRNVTDESEIRNACRFMQTNNNSNIDGGNAVYIGTQNVTNSSLSINDININQNNILTNNNNQYINTAGNLPMNNNNNGTNTINSFGRNIQNSLADKPQINIHTLNSPFTNKLMNDNYNVNGKPVKTYSNNNINNNEIEMRRLNHEKPPVYVYKYGSPNTLPAEDFNNNENGSYRLKRGNISIKNGNNLQKVSSIKSIGKDFFLFFYF